MKSKMGCFVVCFIGIFWLIGFGLLGTGLRSAFRSTQAAGWPTAPATITSLEVQEKSDGDGTTYNVKVSYTYEVDGVAHEGSRLAFGYAGTTGREAHEEIYQRLKEAKSVAVRFDPSNPTESCLSYGLHRSIFLVLVFAAVWLMFMVGFTLLMWLTVRSDTVLLDNLLVQ